MAATGEDIRYYFALIHHGDDAKKKVGYLWVIEHVLVPEAAQMAGHEFGPAKERAVYEGKSYEVISLKLAFDPLQLPDILERTDRYSLYLVPELNRLVAKHERRRAVMWEPVELEHFPLESIGNVLGHLMVLDPPEFQERQVKRFREGFNEATEKDWVARI